MEFIINRPVAIVDLNEGGAIILEPDGKMYKLVAGENKPVKMKGLHLAAYFQFSRTAFFLPGKYPYPKLQNYLLTHRQRSYALRLMVMVMDPETPQYIRKQAAQAAERLLRIPRVQAYVRNKMLPVPLPPFADLSLAPRKGEAGTIFRKIQQRWRG